MQADMPPSVQARFMAHLEPIQGMLISFCRQVVWLPSDCEDVLQNGLATAFDAFGHFQEGTNFRAWLFKHLQNSAWNHNRRRRNLSLTIPDVESQADDFTVYEQVDHELAYLGLFKNRDDLYDHFDDRVHKALLGLTEAERTILLLRSIGEFNYREITEIMEMPLGTVMSNLCRAREKMRWKLTTYARQAGWQISNQEELP